MPGSGGVCLVLWGAWSEGGLCLVLGGLVPGGAWLRGGLVWGVSGPGGAWWRPGGDPRTATAAGGTHPTGMHSCFNKISCIYVFFAENPVFAAATVGSAPVTSAGFSDGPGA